IHRQSRRVSNSWHRGRDICWYVPVPSALDRTSRMDPGFRSLRESKSGIPPSQRRGNSPPVSLALGCSRVLGRFGLGRQSFAISCVSNPVASAGIRGRLERYFRRDGPIKREFAFRRRKLASSAGQTWSNAFSQTFETLFD